MYYTVATGHTLLPASLIHGYLGWNNYVLLIKVDRGGGDKGELKTKCGRSSKQLCTIEVSRGGAILISISDAGKRVWPVATV